MSRPPGGRLHLWFWVTAGVVLYVVSCPPVEAWHEKRFSQNNHKLPLGVTALPQVEDTAAGVRSAATQSPSPSAPSSRTSGANRSATSANAAGDDGEFQIVELKYQEPPKRPVWMQYLYAPVHMMESYPPFDGLFQTYRQWCEGVL